MKSVLILLVACATVPFVRCADSPLDTPGSVSQVQDLESKVSMLQDRLIEEDGTYRIRKGDSGAIIARMFDLTLVDMVVVNPGVDWGHLRAGQLIVIPKRPNKAPVPTATSVTPAANAPVVPAAAAAHL
jgi:LysM repeat protein